MARLLAILLALLIPAAAAAERPSIRLAADHWCPVNCRPTDDKPGYMIEIAREVFGRHGIDVDYSLAPWERALELVRDGVMTGAVGAFPGDGLLLGEAWLGEARMVVARRKGSAFAYAGPDSLQDIRLGAIRHYIYDSGPVDAYLAAAAAGDHVDRVKLLSGADVTNRLILLLMQDRVDAILEMEDVLRWSLQRQGLLDRVEIVAVIGRHPMGIGFSPTLPESIRYAALLKAGMEELRASGRLGEIMARYGLEVADPVGR